MKHIIFFLMFFILQSSVYADTVYMKNGEEQKGIVVEEYIDRIKLSTADGEIEILKNNIKDILYDMPAQNLVKLGDFHRQKGNTAIAYLYYSKAREVDPSFEPAMARYAEVSALLIKRSDKQLENSIEKRKALLQAKDGIIKTDAEMSLTPQEKLQKYTGISLILKKGRPFVEYVTPASPAYQAGVRSGDYIISVWTRLTQYMSLEDVCDAIIASSTGETSITIERTINLKSAGTPGYSTGGIASLGFYLDMTTGGLTVTRVMNNSSAFKNGLAPSDIITSINNKPTRYMPLKETISLIKSSKDNCGITINRYAVIWKKSA
ncbi:MAG: PDZ domain-containing protein [Candidatus Omnitrophica bacterium]|nr:PDZ domain-containing protein [Candidatus Omnitrophota bacterium]